MPMRTKILGLLVLIVVVLGVALCSRRAAPPPPEEDTRLVTLLGEEIDRTEYENLPDVTPEEREEMRGIVDPEEWELWEECVRWRPLRERIHHALFEWFRREHQLEVTGDEVRAYIQYVMIQPMVLYMPDMEVADMPDEDSPEWARTTNELMAWKIENTLFDLYGGRIAVDRGGQWVVALDAYERFLRESEVNGLVQFHADDFRDLFWSCVSVDEFQYPREYVLAEEEDALERLREYPGTRRLRIITDRFANILDEKWALIFEEMEHPPGWPSP